jgi:hypothetical protein
LKQYVEVTRGEPVRWPREARGQAGRSGVSAVAVEAFMNNVGQGKILRGPLHGCKTKDCATILQR